MCYYALTCIILLNAQGGNHGRAAFAETGYCLVLLFFELRKVGKSEGEKQSASMALWLKFFNVKNSEDLAMFESDQVMNNASNILRVMSGDDRLREAARLREKRLHDEATYLATARAEGRAEGRAELLQSIIATFRKGVIPLQTAAQCAGMTELRLKRFARKIKRFV